MKILLAIILIVLCFLVVIGCTKPVCHSEKEQCMCIDVIKTYSRVTIDYIGDKCNCCYEEPVLNAEGFYDVNKKCQGFNVTYKEVCQNV